MVIEASLAAGYLIAWAARKARRVGGRLDAEADAVLDVGLDRLHDVVESKLAGHRLLAELVDEAGVEGQVSEQIRQRMTLAIIAAAEKDEVFGRAVNEQVAWLREAESGSGTSVIATSGSTVSARDVRAHAESGGIAFGQAGEVHIYQDPPGPPKPGRPSR
jgi:hypothetical protein